jgi:hypothetical protein
LINHKSNHYKLGTICTIALIETFAHLIMPKEGEHIRGIAFLHSLDLLLENARLAE